MFNWRSVLDYRMRRPNLSSLKFRMTAISAISSLIVLFITWSTLSGTMREAVNQEAREHSVDLANYFSESIAEAVAGNDRMQVHLQTQTLLRHSANAAIVRHKSGEVLFSSLPVDAAEYAPAPQGVPPTGASPPAMVREVDIDGRPFFSVSKSIHFGSSPVGWIEMLVARRQLESRMQAANRSIYLVFALGFILMVVVGTALLQAPFRALKRLSSVAQEIGDGDLSARVPVNGHDEIAQFCRTFNQMAEKLLQARNQLSREHLQAIEAMISSVEAKDSYTQGHCLRVQEYARQILTSMGIAATEKSDISTAALLHDIGKIGIPDAVLLKRGTLTKSQIETVRSHVIIGENIIRQMDSMSVIAKWVRHHHERWDGSGYPDGLRGKQIPFASRVIAVADCMDAMLTNRPYRTPRTPEELIAVFREEKARQFDPEIVDHAMPLVETMLNSRQRELEEQV